MDSSKCMGCNINHALVVVHGLDAHKVEVCPLCESTPLREEFLDKYLNAKTITEYEKDLINLNNQGN